MVGQWRVLLYSSYSCNFFLKKYLYPRRNLWVPVPMPQGYGYRQIWVWVDPKIPMGYLCRTLDVLTKALPSVKAKHFASALVLSTGMVWGGVLKIFKLCANSILIYILSVYDLILSWYFPFITFFPLFIISCTTMVSLGIHYLVCYLVTRLFICLWDTLP